MKAIIDGKLYDTETATELARWPRMDLDDLYGILYRAPNGSHFILSVWDPVDELTREEGIIPVEDEHLVDTVLFFGVTIDEALRLFPDRIEVA